MATHNHTAVRQPNATKSGTSASAKPIATAGVNAMLRRLMYRKPLRIPRAVPLTAAQIQPSRSVMPRGCLSICESRHPRVELFTLSRYRRNVHHSIASDDVLRCADADIRMNIVAINAVWAAG